VRGTRLVPVVMALDLVACQRHIPPQGATLPLDASHATAIRDSVRVFAESVALGVTARGPAAWRAYLADEPSFFWADEGRLVFLNSDSAGRAMQHFASTTAHIELRWGDSLRIDPLAPGLASLASRFHLIGVDTQGHRVEEDGVFTGIAEHRGVGWRLRNLHWSVAAPPSAVH
jgi:hypothetical protein